MPVPEPPEGAATWQRRFLRTLVTIPLAIWIFLEEWIWDGMLALMAWAGRLPPIHWAERQFTRLPPYAALVAFVIPGAILLPFKLAAVWLIAHGHTAYGLWVFVIAKMVGTAFLARIFSLTKPALMSIGWFKRAYEAVIGWRERLYAYIRALPAYQLIRAWSRELKSSLQGWWRRAWGR